jgi:endogenous inhibitor of DNA gyrase (YacG/DUF329 family)
MSTSPDRPVVRRCPICRKPRDPAFSPFCSTRCRDRDLVNWLEEGYTLPGPVVDPEGDPEVEF